MSLLNFERLEFPCPYLNVDKLSNSVQDDCKADASCVEDKSQRQVEYGQDWIDPYARYVVDDVDPGQIGDHEQCQACQSDAFGWVLAEGAEQLHDDADENVAVEHVVQPVREECVQYLGKNELTIDGVDAPENREHVA